MIKELFYKIKLKKQKVFLEKDVIFKKAEFEGANRVGKGTSIRKSKIGLATYIGENCLLNNVKIGRFCSIGNNIRVVIGNHPLSYLSTHPFCYSSRFEKEGLHFEGFKKFDEILRVNEDVVLEIGNDVWIGDNVIIFGGLKIGDGAVLGAGSVITKDVESYSVVVGVPGKVL
ncbi:MAG: CatB-related O-acetyltransferase, partial [Cetobacterium sp.]